MTTVSHLWADIPTHRSAPLPPALSPVVVMRGPDPLRCKLSPAASPAQAAEFEAWRSVHADTVLLCDERTAQAASAWLARSGREVSLLAESSWDAAAISTLWWRCDQELDDLPAYRELTANLGVVAQKCRMRDTHAVLRVSATSYPVAAG